MFFPWGEADGALKRAASPQGKNKEPVQDRPPSRSPPVGAGWADHAAVKVESGADLDGRGIRGQVERMKGWGPVRPSAEGASRWLSREAGISEASEGAVAGGRFPENREPTTGAFPAKREWVGLGRGCCKGLSLPGGAKSSPRRSVVAWRRRSYSTLESLPFSGGTLRRREFFIDCPTGDRHSSGIG